MNGYYTLFIVWEIGTISPMNDNNENDEKEEQTLQLEKEDATVAAPGVLGDIQ